MQAIPKRQSIGSRWTRSLAILTAMMLGLMLEAVPLRAQTQAFTATLSGAVTDPTGAVIPNAKVTLISVEKGITRTFTTTGSGNYTF